MTLKEWGPRLKRGGDFLYYYGAPYLFALIAAREIYDHNHSLWVRLLVVLLWFANCAAVQLLAFSLRKKEQQRRETLFQRNATAFVLSSMSDICQKLGEATNKTITMTKVDMPSAEHFDA